jgi:hypothetical protein
MKKITEALELSKGGDHFTATWTTEIFAGVHPVAFVRSIHAHARFRVDRTPSSRVRSRPWRRSEARPVATATGRAVLATRQPMASRAGTTPRAG